MEEINNFQQEPAETLYQAWERFKELLMKCPQHYLTEMQEVILFYNGLDAPTRQILDSRGAVLIKTAADAKIAIQEMAKYSQKWHNGTSRGRSTETSDELAAIQAQLNNLGREIKKIDVYSKERFTLRVGEERIVFSSVKPASSLIKRVYMLSLRERMELDLEATLMGETLDMDAYRDEGMSDVIFGKPFLREVGIKTKRFKGIITLYKSDDEVTYQMVRSHL
ncbi:hypothetical protein Tco_1049761, partial [Tanacetum coccineum]